MPNRLWRTIVSMAAVVILSPACSTPQRDTAPSPAAGQSAEEGCELGADLLIDRLEEFLGQLPDITPEEFLALDQVEGLPEFQNDIAQILAENTDQRSTLCNLDGLQDLVTERIGDVEREGVLAEFLIATIRDGRELSTADVSVAPGDDVEAVLGLLDDGSTLTFAPGDYELERPLLVQRSITFIGDGASSTTIRSSSSDAAIVVVGRGVLALRDLSVAHTGDEPASVVLAFDRPVDLRGVRLSGGVADPEGGAGNGLVLTDEAFGGQRFEDPDRRRSVVVDSTLEDNDGAGLAANGSVAPRVERTEIRGNAICGICYFGAASGEVLDSDIHDNEFGVQVGDDSSPLVRGSTISANLTAGIVVIGQAAPSIHENRLEANGEIGVAVQERSVPSIRGNRIVDHRFGLSLLGDSSTEVRDNTMTGGEIGMQLDERAMANIVRVRVEGTTLAGLALSGESSATVTDLEIAPAAGLGVVADGSTSPSFDGLIVDGGEVAVAYTGAVVGSVRNARFTGQLIGVQLDADVSPTFADVEIVDPGDAGIVARGTTSAVFEGVMIAGAGEVGFALTEDTVVTLSEVVVTDSPTAGTVIGTARPLVRSGRFEDIDVGIQIGEHAAPTIEGNSIVRPASAGLVYLDDAAGSATGNDVRDPGVVGIQLGGRARPDLVGNVFFRSRPEPVVEDGGASAEAGTDPDEAEGSVDPGSDGAVADPETVEEEAVEEATVEDATVGLLYAGTAAGVATANQVIGFVIGIQVGESAAPELVDNVLDGGVLDGVGVLWRDRAAGSATGNRTSAHAVGFQIGDSATPILVANEVVTARNVAILVQGEADPRLERNICPEDLAGIGMLGDVDPTLVDNECIEVFGE